MPPSLETTLPRTLAAAVLSVAQNKWTAKIYPLETYFDSTLVSVERRASYRHDSGNTTLMLSFFRCLFVCCGHEDAWRVHLAVELRVSTQDRHQRTGTR